MVLLGVSQSVHNNLVNKDPAAGIAMEGCAAADIPCLGRTTPSRRRGTGASGRRTEGRWSSSPSTVKCSPSSDTAISTLLGSPISAECHCRKSAFTSRIAFTAPRSIVASKSFVQEAQPAVAVVPRTEPAVGKRRCAVGRVALVPLGTAAHGHPSARCFTCLRASGRSARSEAT